MLIAKGGINAVRSDPIRVLAPHHLQVFLAHTLESGPKARCFEREWPELCQFIPHVQVETRLLQGG